MYSRQLRVALLTQVHHSALCYSPTARLDSCRFFRNYQSPQQITQDITIIDALRATWAAPGILPSIPIGPKGREQMVMSAGTRFANPIREVIKEAYHIFGAESQISYILGLGSGFRGFIAVDDGGKITGGSSMDCERVARDIKRSLAKLKVYYRLSVDRGLEGWESFQGGFGAMKSHVDEYLGRDEISRTMDQCIATTFMDGRVSLKQICELMVLELPLLTLGRWFQATRNSIDTRTTTSLRILCHAQETNGDNHQ
jgi:hypothetical protein